MTEKLVGGDAGRLFIGRQWMVRLASGLAVALLAWGLTTATALAEGRWRQIENKAICAVWHGNPQPNEKMTWTGGCANGKAEGRGRQV